MTLVYIQKKIYTYINMNRSNNNNTATSNHEFVLNWRQSFSTGQIIITWNINLIALYIHGSIRPLLYYSNIFFYSFIISSPDGTFISIDLYLYFCMYIRLFTLHRAEWLALKGQWFPLYCFAIVQVLFKTVILFAILNFLQLFYLFY